MTDTQGQSALPAAWYPDPDDATRVRWWDGAAWTNHTNELPPPPGARTAVQQPTAPVIATGEIPSAEESGFIVNTRVPETGSWYAETGHSYVPQTSYDHLPASLRDDNDDFDKDDDIGSTVTVETWVMAFLPAVAFALMWGLLAYTRIVANNPALFWVIPILFVVANFAFATMDRGALAARNHKDTPSQVLGIVPPVYLLARTLSIGSSSVGPLLVWIVSAFVLFNPFRLLYVHAFGG
jgi:hypothetical protein